jgi:hypothetical protein
MVKERIKHVCVAVKKGVRVRRNCNVFNLAMENVFKFSEIRDQKHPPPFKEKVFVYGKGVQNSQFFNYLLYAKSK